MPLSHKKWLDRDYFPRLSAANLAYICKHQGTNTDFTEKLGNALQNAWEKVLGDMPVPQTSVVDLRATIIAELLALKVALNASDQLTSATQTLVSARLQC